ncbi:hypothetical protein EMPS_02653 [Entomortierella parvispora]|uniref:PHD-type domain-containing protein n=1 Tax=Entomortierella parvispora TaxID=205924 RepID=A0A9P3H548_9FUNG|nr:hypothetical protein EMPS_02653 [Entomortierella parvispora]
MLSSDSGSSDLSDAASLSSDNSLGSGSEDDHRTVKVKMRTQASSSIPPKTSTSAPLGAKQQATRTARGHSFSSSDSGDSSDPSSSDLDDDENGGHGKRPPNHLRASKKYPSTKSKDKKDKRAQVQPPGNAPISLSASQPVYSQDIITATTSAIASRGISTPSRGRGRGRGRAPLAGHGSRKYDASGATVIDFEDSSQQDIPPLNSTVSTQQTTTAPATPARSKKEQSIERTKTAKPSKAGTSKPKAGARKAGRPKTVSKDVYCICRGPYDGVEFMIACDRCEEWFHGRCIGMKPQDAKKSNHYFCDTCQRIRQMLGVSTAPQEVAKPLKAKSRSKKSEEKRIERQEMVVVDLSDDDPIMASPLLRQDIQGSTVDVINPGFEQGHHVVATEPTPGVTLSTHKQTKPNDKASKRKGIPQEPNPYPPTPVYGIAPAIPSVITVTAAATAAHRINTDDEDEEDVCPVCEDECTCNTGGNSVQQIASTTPLVDNSPGFSAIKVPFQPNRGSKEPTSIYTQENYRIMSEDEGVPEGAQPLANDTFHTSYKNPMSIPRRPSILRRGGKGIGKAPHLMQAVKGQSRGKSLKGGKASMHFYQQSLSTSSSEMSDALSDEDEDEDDRDRELQNEPLPEAPRVKYDREKENIPADGHVTLSSSSSQSDSEEERTAAPRQRTKNELGSLDIIRIRTPIGSPSTSTAPLSVEVKVETKKRGPGRPKKLKDALVVSREDEQALYTPAVIASRKSASSHKHGPNRSEAASTIIIESDFPFIAYDPEVAEDVKALNRTTSDESDADVSTPSDATGARPVLAVSHEDIFGDGDFSDELSGDLSDILSEDLDDLSDDGLDFTSSDEEDETSSSSSPREFHYSEMEEQDESLVDSDSSENSVSSESSGSSDLDSDSELEPYPQEFSDEDQELYEFEVEGEEDLIDDEELIRLAEQERHFLSKAQGLHEDFSDEESDPGRNPFESSESEHEKDEHEFDGDEDEYSDEFYDNEYSDDEFGDLTEAEILEQFRGSQADLALMMIPPEQQEQLLLLQHYEETHRLHQQLQQQPLIHQQESSLDHQGFHPHNGSHIDGVLAAPDMMQSFDMNVPDLDAVSQQLAASLANSIASSMAGSMAQSQNGSFLTSATDGQGIEGDASQSSLGASGSNSNTIGLVDSVSPISASSTSPSSSAQAWTTPASLTPTDSSVTGSATIPTPANTPTPPGTVAGTSPSIPTLIENVAPGSALTAEDQSLPVNPPQLATTGSGSYKEAAQRAFAGLPVQINTQLTEPSSVNNSNDGATRADEVIPSGDTTDEASPTMHGGEFRKRQNEQLLSRDVVMSHGKRRRLSLAVQSRQDSKILPAATSGPSSMTASETDTANVRDALAEMNASMSGYDFSKPTMPFVDPAARIIMSPPTVRSRKFSLKGKEAMHASDYMPMDDLLDTSALYGRSSSRSPSPERSEISKADETEMSQSALKDLHRWERVPIGTFRKSRRPSSPYVGLQGALKFGNVTMPATLLANHQQHQHQLAQESHRLQRKSGGLRKYRPSSSTSDIMSSGIGRYTLPVDSSGDRYSLAHFKQQHLRTRSTNVSAMAQTPPSALAGMTMEGLAGFGSPDGLMKAPLSYNRAFIIGDKPSASRGSGLTSGRRRHRSKNSSARSGHRLSQTDTTNTGLGIGLDRDGGGDVGKGQRDVMTDSSQLPSSACPTPLHSPLFSATRTEDRVHHQTSGEAIDPESSATKLVLRKSSMPRPEESLVPHFELDIAKEMEGFHDRLLAKKAAMEDESAHSSQLADGDQVAESEL